MVDQCNLGRLQEVVLLTVFPRAEHERLKREYHSIRQTNTETSTEFMQRFLRLAGFLEAAAGQTATGKESSNPFMAGVNTPRSDEDRLKLIELMVFLLQKDFWNTASVKRSGDVTRLQALVDKKKIVIFEAVIHEILQLNDAEGVVCLPNKEIFDGLAQMGYEKPSTKLTFYKDFLSSQWKFLIHTILQSLSAKRTSWNEFSIAMASAVICLSKEEEVTEAQVQVDAAVEAHVAEDVSHDAIPSPPPHDAEFPSQLQQVLNVCSALSKYVENLENDNAAQKLEIVQLKVRVKKFEKANKIKSSKLRRLRKVGTSRRVESSDDMEDVFNQGRMIVDIDMNEGIELVKDAKVTKSEGRNTAEHAEKQAEIYKLDLDHSSKVLSMQEDDSEVQEVVEVVTTAKLITKPSILAAAPTVVAAYTRRIKGVIIRDLEEELLLKTPAETPKVKDKGKGILVEAPKPMKKKDQIETDVEYARKLQEEIERDHDGFNKDIDWDAAMDHEMEAEDQEIIKSINETPTQKATKRRKLSEEAQEAKDLRKQLEVVEDEDDDVFGEATPLASKTMFKEPDGQDAIWRNQKSVHGLAVVKRWKLLTLCGVHVITLSTV
nr:zinc finger, CCHC-type, retrotransposon Gag domain protein [Tanacetum cinerariifolium]